MLRPTALSAFLLLALAGSARALAPATYYVSPSGSDAASGTSPSSAWKTLQHAADLVGPGDTVIALAGNHAGFHLDTSGTPSSPITFTAAPGASQANPLVVIDANNPVTKDRINLEGASHVVIEGFTVIGSGDPATNRTGIRTVGSSDDFAREVTIRANRIDRCGTWGILTGHVDDLLIEDNEASRSAEEHGIYVSNSGDRPVVRRNRIWGNHSNGLHMNGDLSLGGDGVISDALVEANVVYENGNGDPAFGPPGGSAINCDGVVDSVIENNLLYANHKSGISLYRIDGGAPSTGNRVIANTVHMAADARFALNIKDASSGNTARNNVLLNDHATRGSIDIESDCLPGFASDHNALEERFGLDGVFLNFAQWKAATGQDSTSFLATTSQLFLAPAAADYQLQPSGPAVDAGSSLLAPPLDLLGKHRPALAGFDIGAYEHAACFGQAVPYGAGLAGSGGFAPALASTGCPDLGATFALAIGQGVGGAHGLVLLGSQALSLPLLDGTLLVAPTLLLPFTLGGSAGVPGAGAAALPLAVPSDAGLLGQIVRFQALAADPGAPQGVSMSAGLAAAVGG